METIEFTNTDLNAITFLNMSGDVTITWDETNKEAILSMIRKKMSEGYIFFTTKKVPIVPVYRKVKVKEHDLENLDTILIDDATFDRMMKGVDDEDVLRIVRDKKGRFAKRKDTDDLKMIKRAKTAEEVVEKNQQSVGLRKIQGG